MLALSRNFGALPVGTDKVFTLSTRLAVDTIQSVNLYANNEIVYTGAYSAELIWKSPAVGVYKVYAVITDRDGNAYTTKALNTDIV